jgi:hypothetical protein
MACRLRQSFTNPSGVLRRSLETLEEVTITLTQLLTDLSASYRAANAANGGDAARVKLPKGWPSTERMLVNELRRCAPVLRRKGIHIENAEKHPESRKAQRTFKKLEVSETTLRNLRTLREGEVLDKNPKETKDPKGDSDSLLETPPRKWADEISWEASDVANT